MLLSDAISESNPRVIDDRRARQLASDLKRCSYFETCATYGLNVERVFQDGKCTPPPLGSNFVHGNVPCLCVENVHMCVICNIMLDLLLTVMVV